MDSIPDELITHICVLIPTKYIFNISLISQRFHKLWNTDYFWELKYILDFNHNLINDKDNWKNYLLY